MTAAAFCKWGSELSRSQSSLEFCSFGPYKSPHGHNNAKLWGRQSCQAILPHGIKPALRVSLDIMLRTAQLLVWLAWAAAAQEKPVPLEEQAATLIARGKYAEAEPLLVRALEAREKELRAEAPA